MFTAKELNCRGRNCDSCMEKKAFQISKIESAHPKLSPNHKYYQEGCYWECISLPPQPLSILDLFQEIIDCLNKLGKDIQNASRKLDLMKKMFEYFQTTRIDEFLIFQRMNEFSKDILSEADISEQGASICILFLLPTTYFDTFKEYCFPSQIEYVIQGIDSSKFFKAFIERSELKEISKYVIKTLYNENEEVIVIIGKRSVLETLISALDKMPNSSFIMSYDGKQLMLQKKDDINQSEHSSDSEEQKERGKTDEREER